jgi:hypothetical protein
MEGLREVSYWCTTGHPIPSEALGSDTEIVSLDRGAEVRICREHGAPIALREEEARRD